MFRSSSISCTFNINFTDSPQALHLSCVNAHTIVSGSLSSTHLLPLLLGNLGISFFAVINLPSIRFVGCCILALFGLIFFVVMRFLKKASEVINRTRSHNNFTVIIFNTFSMVVLY